MTDGNHGNDQRMATTYIVTVQRSSEDEVRGPQVVADVHGLGQVDQGLGAGAGGGQGQVDRGKISRVHCGSDGG